GYRLTIEPATPDFVVVQPVTEVNVPRSGSALLAVPVVRRGYAGPIELTVPNLPPGLSVQGGHVPANATAGLLTLTAAESTAALPEPVSLSVEGKAADGKTELHRIGEHRFVVSRDANVAAASQTWRQVPLGVTSAEPFAVAGPANLELVKGYPTTVTTKLTRAKDQAAVAIQVTGVGPVSAPSPGQPPPPAPLVFQPSQPAAGDSATFTVTVPVN